MINDLGFVRVGAIVPKLKVANTEFNALEIIKQIKNASNHGIDIVTTPELAVTGYTCGDLFRQEILISSALKNLEKILKETSDLDIISIIGIPLENRNKLFNCAVVIQKGEILAVIPKIKDFQNQRYFSTESDTKNDKIILFGKEIPFGNNLILEDEFNKNISFSVTIGENGIFSILSETAKIPRSAMIIFNPSATEEIVRRHEVVKNNVNCQAMINCCGYVYCSAGVNESSTNAVFSGYSMISENGCLLGENKRFDFESNLIYSDIDILKLKNDRMRQTNFINTQDKNNNIYISIKPLKDIKLHRFTNNDTERDTDINTDDNVDTNVESDFNSKFSKYKIARNYPEYPFIPKNNKEKEERCKEIIDIQSSALAKRLMHTGIKRTVIGLSGGLDSTLAFLVIIEAYKKLKIENSNMIAVTMPGFGTTGRTYQNACKLAKVYGVTLQEISIKNACIGHMKDIGLDVNDRGITYENAQARERTQILMDIANKEGALVIGTGDLSELALGWCTYNGDHMSMYAVNANVPKTLVRCLIQWMADNTKEQTLYDILDTPISPELLPPDECGNLIQKTENTIGPYVLHDFFLYHFLRYGASPKKIYFLAKQTFDGKFEDKEIKKWLKMFLKRFFSQQFKRNCSPDGPMIGSIGIKPIFELEMPSDADASIWLKELEDCE